MPFPQIHESDAEIAGLTANNPLMSRRLRVLQAFKRNPFETSGNVADRLGVFEYEIERWARLYQAGGINLVIDPQTSYDPAARQDLTFSQHAEIRTLELFKEHNNQIGRQLWVDLERCRKNDPRQQTDVCQIDFPDSYAGFVAKYKDWYRTDCQTYILDVLKYAFEKIGYRKLYTGLLAAFKREGTTGTVMAKYLTQLEWKAYFFMPDAVQPNDGDGEHIKKYESALKTKTWWGVPITNVIVNYRPTTKMRSNAKVSYGNPFKPIAQDAEGLRKFRVLETALFGVCIFTAGIHTALFSKGMIYEVHWKGISDNIPDSPVGRGDALYERFPLYWYGETDRNRTGYIEGIVVVPPDISL